jgi:LysM repeat protein
MRLRIVLALATVAALASPAAAYADFGHVVAPGESLTSIAAADGLSVAALAAANDFASDAELITGSVVEIPPQDHTSSNASVSGRLVSTREYVVRPGDTLSGIAGRGGVSVSYLADLNHIKANALLLAGSTLIVPGAAQVTASGLQLSSATGLDGSSGGPPYPTPERVTASQVEQVAVANDVSPSLAAAIAWQESGFNNDFVSSADARGVMQILPSTWDWIQGTLAAGTPLAPASAIDNVRGGVLLLRSLLNSTEGDPALAVAGYIQGLSSVDRNGMFPSTQQYVASVLALRERFGGP